MRNIFGICRKECNRYFPCQPFPSLGHKSLTHPPAASSPLTCSLLPRATHPRPSHCPAPQVLGAKRKTLAGFSSTTTQPHQGFIHACAIMHTTPPSLRGKAARLIAAKSTLLARKDAYGEDPAVRGKEHDLGGPGGGHDPVVRVVRAIREEKV